MELVRLTVRREPGRRSRLSTGHVAADSDRRIPGIASDRFGSGAEVASCPTGPQSATATWIASTGTDDQVSRLMQMSDPKAKDHRSVKQTTAHPFGLES